MKQPIKAHSINFNKLFKSIILLVLSALIMTLSISAWLAAWNPSGDTNPLGIDNPPILYLLDSDTSEVIQLSLTGLSAGQTMEYVFCVSSVGPTSSIPSESGDDNTNKAINLELAHTNNLNVEYSISRATYSGTEPSPAAFPFTSQHGITLYYTKNETPLTEMGKREDTVDGNVEYTYFDPVKFDRQYCFFVLSIAWPEEYDSATLQKETDVIYIIAKGGYINEAEQST